MSNGASTPQVFSVESATVFRAGGRRFFSKLAAIRAYARQKVNAKHRCDCEQGDYSSGYPGYDCGIHEGRDRLTARYVRFLRAKLRKVKS